jgi:CDP-paratose 2-epimerase
MKILITGGCGFVGSNLCVFIKKNISKAKVYSLDNLYRKGSILNQKRLKSYGVKNFKIDIKDNLKISKLPKFDLIVDCCAEASVEISAKQPNRVFYTNLVGTFNILEKCRKDKTNLIFLSSSRVYSINSLRKIINKKYLKKKINSKILIDESFDTSSPKSIYGMTKYSSEQLIQEYNYAYNIKYLINRFGVISGPWQFGKQDQGFISLWILKHLFKKKLKYIGFGGFGNQIRDVIHVDDVCEIIVRQIKKIKRINNQIFNIGGGIKNSLSLRELTIACQNLTKRKIYIERINHTSKFDIPYYVSNNKKIKQFYNWTPKKNLENILMDIFEWIRLNQSQLKKNLD